jgi:hypothetical protein
MKNLNVGLIAALIIIFTQCESPDRIILPEFSVKTAFNSANMMWAKTMADINGNGILDIVFQDGNARGGWLGWFETSDNIDSWQLHVIADSTKFGAGFAAGDLKTGDFNNNGRIDVLGVLHPGEWNAGGAESTIYWFENPSWTPHYIGKSDAFVKDLAVADLTNNGKLDVVAITFVRNSLQIFTQDNSGWTESLNITIPNLHEGMHAGDINGNGFIDIATNGYWLRNPGNDQSRDWELLLIDEKWNNQGGNWERNATKVFCTDIDGDGKTEVFISHSESRGYPLSYYKLVNVESNIWEENIIDYIDGCHTLQVYDFNGNGHLDILAGQNGMRWPDDRVKQVSIYLNTGDNKNFIKHIISTEGIYNGLAADIKGNGLYDFLRFPGHGSEVLEVWVNKPK